MGSSPIISTDNHQVGVLDELVQGERPEVEHERAGLEEFLAADGVDDWVVLHGGATAVFQVGSVGEAARLAEAVAEVDGFQGSEALLTIVDASLTVRLTPWPDSARKSRHVDLARAVSEVASAHGAVADRASRPGGAVRDRLDAGCGGCRLLARGARLRAAGRRHWRRPARARVDGLDAGARRGQAAAARDALDVSVAREHVEARLAAALAAGGRVVWESEEHWTLADRAGNRVCITAWPDGATKAPPDPT